MSRWYEVHAESTGMRHTFWNNINTFSLIISVFTYTVRAWSWCPSWTESVLNLLPYFIKVLILVKTLQADCSLTRNNLYSQIFFRETNNSLVCFPLCKSQNRGLKYSLWLSPEEVLKIKRIYTYLPPFSTLQDEVNWAMCVLVSEVFYCLTPGDEDEDNLGKAKC